MNREQKIREDRAASYHEMLSITETAERENRDLTSDEQTAFDKAERALKIGNAALELDDSGVPETRQVSNVRTAGRAFQWGPAPEIQGTPNEPLGPGQSMTEWNRRAAENGVMIGDGARAHKSVHRDQDFLNDFWGYKLGLTANDVAYRAMGEDSVGSGQAVVPQSWTANFIDFLYANTVMGQLGMTRVPQATEIYNMPQFTAPVQPAWLAENSTIGIDANPAFSTLQFNAQGGFKDITLYSVELAQDAYVNGTLPGMLASSAARNYALAVDKAALFGVTGNAGNPGLYNETGLQVRGVTGSSTTSGASLTDTTDFSVAAEKVRIKNAEPTGGILANPQTYGTVSRLNASTVAKFWDMPQDVSNLPWVYSTIMPAVETANSSGVPNALTGGALSSYVLGDWRNVIMGSHLELTSTRLSERYVDYGQVGLFSLMRFSIRTAHPETFVRSGGLVTS